MWDPLSGKLVSQKSLGSEVRATNFSADGKRLVTLMSDGAIQVWDVETWAQVGKTMRHESPSGIQFSPDGARILSMVRLVHDCGTPKRDNRSATLCVALRERVSRPTEKQS